MLSTVGIINLWLVVCYIIISVISIKKILLVRNSSYNKQNFINEMDIITRKMDLGEMLNVTKSYPQNHIAWAIEVALDGLDSFNSNQTKLETMELINNSIQRCRNTYYLKFNSGLYFLLSIAITSPMLGLFASIVIIEQSFHSMCNTDSPPLVHLCYHLSFAPYETAYGLIVGIPAFWFYVYFVHKNKALLMEYDLVVSNFLKFVTKLS
jgi:biopolymer transport protein ExbB/TolQ